MSKLNNYIADYLIISPHTDEQSQLLASNACIVGSPLTITYNKEKEIFPVLTQHNKEIGTVKPSNPLAIQEALSQNYTQYTRLSYVALNSDTKLFMGELAYQFFKVDSENPEWQKYFERFAQITTERVAAGERPVVSLDASDYSKIVEAEGSLKTDGQTDDPDFPKNTIPFKKKRSLADKLVLAAFQNKPGCRIASTLFLVAILVIIVVAILKIFL